MLTRYTHSLDPRDAAPCARFRAAAAPRKGAILGPEARPIFDAMRGATPLAEGVRVEPATVGGVPGVWCRVQNAVPGRSLLFLHGGGYMLGSAGATAGFGSQFAARAQADTFVPDYRLAPEHPFPAAFLDAQAAYHGLTSDADGPVALAGESAGGGLVLALLAALQSSGQERQPIAAAVMSPWADLSLAGESYGTRAEADPIFTRDALAALADTYLQGHDARDPRASPLAGPTYSSCPLRIDVGEDEVLLDDARAYAERAAATGAPVMLAVWQGMPHVFQARVEELAAARASFDASGAFLAQHFPDWTARA